MGPGRDRPRRAGPRRHRHVQYGEGGKRYLPGEWPKTDPKVFDDDGAVALYDEAPDAAKIDTGYQPITS